MFSHHKKAGRTGVIAVLGLLASTFLLSSIASAQQNYSVIQGVWNRRTTGLNNVPTFGERAGNCTMISVGVIMRTALVPTPTLPGGGAGAGLPQNNASLFGCPDAYPNTVASGPNPNAIMISATGTGTGAAFTIPGAMRSTAGASFSVSVTAMGGTSLMQLGTMTTLGTLSGALIHSPPPPGGRVTVSIPANVYQIQLATGGKWTVPLGTRGGHGLYGLRSARVGYLTMNGNTAMTVPGNYVTAGPTMAAPALCTGDALSATMGATCTNLAPFRRFEANAWQNQTGRVGPNFTWCWGGPTPAVTMTGPGGSPACTQILNGIGNHQAMVKFRGGKNNFGGTTNQITTSVGGNAGNFISLIPSIGFVVTQLGTPRIGRIQVQGRGYADFAGNYLAPISMGYTNAAFNTNFFQPVLMAYISRIVALTGPIPVNLGPGQANNVYGMPNTTGSVIGRRLSGSPGMSTYLLSVSGAGSDTITAMGARNISVVSGSLSALSGSGRPNVTFTTLFLPEPTRAAQVFAGVAALMGLAAWRLRRQR